MEAGDTPFTIILPSDSNFSTHPNNKASHYEVNHRDIWLGDRRWEVAVESVIYSNHWKGLRPALIHVWIDLVKDIKAVDAERQHIPFTFVPGPDTVPHEYKLKQKYSLSWRPVDSSLTVLRTTTVRLLDQDLAPLELANGSKTSVELMFRPAI